MSAVIQVQLFSVFRQLAGGAESIAVPLHEGARLRDLLTRLTEMYGSAFEKGILLPDGTGLAHDATVLLNGGNVLSHDGLDTQLRLGDCVAILISISGG
jgi:molybdopterin converting factor small subunit